MSGPLTAYIEHAKTATPDPYDVDLCREWAKLYRMRGFHALPSRMDEKRPLVNFREYWESPTPENLVQRHETTNLQILLGRYWRLLVIDLDGNEAFHRFPHHMVPQTWITHSGGNGRHVWFRLPADYPKPLPKAFLWQGTGNHEAIERLCDRSLVVAPPSIHPKTGQRYRFLDRWHSPQGVGIPADCPQWLLDWPPIAAPKLAPPPGQRQAPKIVRTTPGAGQFTRQEVLDSIPDKIALAKSWGVRFNGRRGGSGWHECHAVDRDDDVASAAVHEEQGTYRDLGSNAKYSLFDLGVACGIYADYRDAISDLGQTYGHRNRLATCPTA